MKREIWILFWLFLAGGLRAEGASLTVASYNLELYLEQPALNSPLKSEASKAKIRESLRAINADVVALQEMGGLNALRELRERLAKEGLNYPHFELLNGHDTNLHLAFLSKLPIAATHRFTNENYLLRGKRFHLARGFLGIEVIPPGGPRCLVLTCHLKSKRLSAEADEAEMRGQEAALLSEKVAQLLITEGRDHLILLGDLNDSIDSSPLHIIAGRGKSALYDTRPAEKNGDTGYLSNPKFRSREVVWTHYFGRDETFGRLDYILLSQKLRNHLNRSKTYVLAAPDWGVGSDHRPITACLDF